jgi:hypothetical protein
MAERIGTLRWGGVYNEAVTVSVSGSAERGIVPVGIHVRGSSHHLEIRDNRIHDVETRFEGAEGGGAAERRGESSRGWRRASLRARRNPRNRPQK